MSNMKAKANEKVKKFTVEGKIWIFYWDYCDIKTKLMKMHLIACRSYLAVIVKTFVMILAFVEIKVNEDRN